MSTLVFILSLIAVSMVAAFYRRGLQTWAASLSAVFVGFAFLGSVPAGVLALSAILLGGLLALLMNSDWRRQWLTKPTLAMYQKLAPNLSDTEKVALAAGTVGWEGELFSGKPNWSKLLKVTAPELSSEERAFVDGPVEEACAMTNDWEVTHRDADLPPETWEFLKKNKFFGMIIPKRYGGMGFSATAHAAVLEKLASVSGTLSSTVAVPNSLGPGELLLHYGTEEQKDFYLPKLAIGKEIPCFGLTGPTAGSDATSIPDVGIVCKGRFKGKQVLGMRLTFDKRYITLAPVATVVGLAFQMRDPDHLLGDETDLGITLALLPRNTKGMEIGRRHLPLNMPFQNGPIKGKDIFVPLDYIIGGQEMIGEGWRMLVECLSVGRAISLPSNSVGAMKMGVYATGAYARIRRQFGLAIGRFGGVEEALARVGGYTYQASALSRMTSGAVDLGEKPAVPSAIAKYHTTELSRELARDAMDIHGGKGVILGPKNYLGRWWQGVPIAITVEGANILTRSMMIYGQGAIRCHPFVLPEIDALEISDREERLQKFDQALFGHVGFAASNAVRSILLAVTGGRIARVPRLPETRRFYQMASRYSAALAIASDIAMLVLGGKLKRMEKLSARLGDVLSHLYIVSSMLKRFEDQGRPHADLPLLVWACRDEMNKIQHALDGFIRNFNHPFARYLLRFLVFPTGRRSLAPTDRMGHQVCSLLLAPSDARKRLTDGIYKTASNFNMVGKMNDTLIKVIATEPLEKTLTKAIRGGVIESEDPEAQLKEAVKKAILTRADANRLREVRAEIAEIVAVDDFESSELAQTVVTPKRRTKAA